MPTIMIVLIIVVVLVSLSLRVVKDRVRTAAFHNLRTSVIG
jgi:hypothetical protein